MRYEYTCNYETSLDYLSTIVSSSKKEQKILLDTFKNNGYLSVDTKKFFREMTQISFDIGDLEVWFNPLVVDLAKELLLKGIVTEKGTEIKETLQLLQDEDKAWDVFPEGGSDDFIRSYLNPLTSKNPYNEHLEGIPYAPAGGSFGTGFANMLQERYDNGTLLEYHINDILLKGMGQDIQFRVIETGWIQKMRGYIWRLYSGEKNWYYGAGWAVFKIPLQHPSKPFMNWELESPWEVKE